MKIIKKQSNIIPSANDSDELDVKANILSLIMIASTRAHKSANGISFRVVLFDIFSALILAVSHSISRMFAIFDPMIFPSTISLASLTLPIILTTNSGADVQNATIVSPITILGIRSFFANDDAPSTRKSAHLISRTKPMSMRI
jgi:hypothetical protein